MSGHEEIQTLLNETRIFNPPSDFSKDSMKHLAISYEKLIKDAQSNHVSFWENIAEEYLTWFRKWDRPLEWNPPFAKWYLGGKINAAYNCLDRHLTDKADKIAIIWEGENGSQLKLTYKELYKDVCRLSNALESDFQIKENDSVAIYMPMMPEAVVAMLACARIGALHNVIFAGFQSHAIKSRIDDAECKVVITADSLFRKGKELDLLSTVREGIKDSAFVKNVLVLRRKKDSKLTGIEVDWSTLLAKHKSSHKPKELDSEHPLFILYTSGTTGKPKGIVHSTGGYLALATYSAQWIFNLKTTDIYWCTADLGWITGHTYVVYGMLASGATVVMYEGALNHPHPGRIWEIIERHKVSILYTAPTAIRSFIQAGDEHPNRFNLQSLRLLGSVGEPINPEAWVWYYEVIGKKRCPIVDTWWQTETGGIMIAPIPGITATKPGSATKPIPGIAVDVVDESGKSCEPRVGGSLVITKPWPSMLRDVFKDSKKLVEQYWTKYPGVYLTGDGAHKDKDGYFWIKGRIDDVLNVSGHRLGTMEIESALVSFHGVSEAAVVARADHIKGQAIVAYVVPQQSLDLNDLASFKDNLKAHVSAMIGPIARPDEIIVTRMLPKTRSGKIMRRMLKLLAEKKGITGDLSTLENTTLIDVIE